MIISHLTWKSRVVFRRTGTSGRLFSRCPRGEWQLPWFLVTTYVRNPFCPTPLPIPMDSKLDLDILQKFSVILIVSLFSLRFKIRDIVLDFTNTRSELETAIRILISKKVSSS